ncbi:MAG: nitroreductase family protein [Verrucomicrobiota bacterium]
MGTDVEVLENTIRSRVTEKVLGSLESRKPVPASLESIYRTKIESALRTAGWAPFHYPRDVDGLAEPWRAHILWNSEVRDLSRFLSEELGLTSKEPQLAAACSALVVVTWLPEETDSVSGETARKVSERNREHLAATSAMVQNFLLLMTAQGIGNYWSSGGAIRSKEVFAALGIPPTEHLLAAVFLEYPEMKDLTQGQVERKSGGLRERRSMGWLRTVSEFRS